MVRGLIAFSLTRRAIVLLGLFVFVGLGLFAFSRLNIEAYPNPAPVILEITAQSSGLSAEEMERYFSIPIEVGLAATPGVDVIRYTVKFNVVKQAFDVDVSVQSDQTITCNCGVPSSSEPPQTQGPVPVCAALVS